MPKVKRKGPPSAEHRDSIRRRLVALYAGNEAIADKWLRTPNVHLEGRVPIKMIRMSGTSERAVEMLVGTMEQRIPI